MITPLQVEVLASQQIIHNDMGSRASVEDVAKNVKLVDAQLVDDITDSYNEVSRLPNLDDCLNDSLHISIFVFVVWAFVEEFFDDVGELLWQGFADLASSVFTAHRLTNLNELQEGAGIVTGEVFVRAFLYHFQSLFWIVDESAEVAHFLLWERVFKQVVNLSLNVSAGISEDMEEGFMLAMNVGNKVLGTFRKT